MNELDLHGAQRWNGLATELAAGLPDDLKVWRSLDWVPSVLTPEWIDSFLSANEGHLESVVKLNIGGNPVDVPAVSQCRQKNFVVDSIQAGGTAKIEQLESRSLQVGALCLALESAIGVSTQAKAFITAAGHRGYAPHLDGTDVLVLQLVGAKKWRFHGQPISSPLATMGRVLTAAESETVTAELTLTAGDVAFIPCGMAHSAACDDSPSVHLSIGLQRPRVSDVIAALLEQAAQLSPSVRAPVTASDVAAMVNAGLEKMLDVARTPGSIEKLLQGLQEKLLLQRPQVADQRLVHALRTATVGDESLLTQPPWVRSWLERGEEEVVVKSTASTPVAGMVGIPSVLQLPGPATPDLEMLLANAGTRPLRELEGNLDGDSRVLLAQALVQRGILISV